MKYRSGNIAEIKIYINVLYNCNRYNVLCAMQYKYTLYLTAESMNNSFPINECSRIDLDLLK